MNGGRKDKSNEKENDSLKMEKKEDRSNNLKSTLSKGQKLENIIAGREITNNKFR